MRKGQTMTSEQKAKYTEAQRKWRAAAPPTRRVQKPNKAGYVEVRLTNHPFLGTCRMYEHRLIIAEELGRALTRIETVHHRNGIRSDNARSNLIYCPSHADHLHHHHSTHPVSQETRDKISAAKKGKPGHSVSAQRREAMRNQQTERMADPANRQAISEAMRRHRAAITRAMESLYFVEDDQITD